MINKITEVVLKPQNTKKLALSRRAFSIIKMLYHPLMTLVVHLESINWLMVQQICIMENS